MFTASPLALTALRALSDAACYQRQILCELIHYFDELQMENKIVFKERFLNFTDIIEATRQLHTDKTVELIKQAIEQYGKGRMTARYASLLLKLQREIEKFGCEMLAKYFESQDWSRKHLAEYSHVLRNIPSKIAVHQMHKLFEIRC